MDEIVDVSAELVSWLAFEDAGATSITAELSVNEVVAAGACVLSMTGASEVGAGIDDTETAASPSGVEDTASVGTCEWTTATGLAQVTIISGVDVVEATASELVGVTVVSEVGVNEGPAVTVTTHVVMVYPTGHWPASSRIARGLAETAVAAPRMAALSRCWYFIVYRDPAEVY